MHTQTKLDPFDAIAEDGHKLAEAAMKAQTKQAKHTPLHRNGTHIYAQQNPGGIKTAIAEVFRDAGAQAADEYAALIIKAVNSHEELLGALQAVVTFYSKSTNGKSHLLSDDEAGLVSRCKAALTHATGE